MSDLAKKKCTPCEGGLEPMDRDRARDLLIQVPGWALDRNGTAIRRTFPFKGFLRTMSFINACAWIASQQGHHPDFTAGFDYCDVRFTTHAIRGLSENDFICAYRINAIWGMES